VTFSPDNSRVVVSAGGVLTQRDATNGALVGAIALPATKYGTHPDWSPDGTILVFTLSEDADSDNVSGSDLALLRAGDGGFIGTPQTLVARAISSETNAYPTFAPDGQRIAFVRSQKNTHGDATGQLWLVAADGGAPVRLDRANFVVNNATVPQTTALANNM